MQDRALAQATAALPSSDRSLTVAWFGAYGGNWRPLDRDVTNELVGLTGREPARAMLYREASVGGRFINLRGAVDLGRYVHLESGRLPKPCTPTYCEVLRIQGTGPIPSKPTIRLVQVGRATLDPDAPFASFIQPATTGIVSAAVQYHRPQPSPVVLAEGVDGVSRTPGARLVLPLVCVVPAGSPGRRAPLERRDVHEAGRRRARRSSRRDRTASR